MPAVLVPHAAIPELAARVTPGMLKVLRYLQKADFILNGKELDGETAKTLQKLAALGLVDPGYEEDANAPRMWIPNGNGTRVLAYKTGIRGGTYFELPSSELAAWLERQGPDRWWNVDGDPLLTGRLSFPCPARNIASELRKIGRPLLVQAKQTETAANGQPITEGMIDAVVDEFGNNVQGVEGEEKAPWSRDRFLNLCWKGSIDEWLLSEDTETTALMQTLERGRASEMAPVEKE